MEYLKYIFISVLSVLYFIILIFGLKAKRTFKVIFINALSGIAALLLINLTSRFSGVFIPVNWYSVIGGCAFGIPAVCLFLILPFIFM